MKLSTINIIGLILIVLCLVSCENKIEKSETLKNKYPIEFIGNKILEYTKPYVYPSGVAPVKEDTFRIYSIKNKSKDTIWIETLPNVDSTLGFKDQSIKNIFKKKIHFHEISLNQWVLLSDGNGCWGSCNDSVKLYPNHGTYFIMTESYKNNYDSIRYDIVIKIKHNQSIKDTILTKRLILHKNNYFIEDAINWN